MAQGHCAHHHGPGGSQAAQAAGMFAPDAPGMTGDWGGVRNELLQKGYDLTLDYVGELGYNAHGGYDQDHTARWSGQFTLGAKLDLQKILGWEDATFKLARDSKYGYWLVAQQQVTAHDGDPQRGLSLFANVTVPDRETSQVGHFLQAGLTYKGLFDARPQDDIGVGVARIHTNSRYRDNQRLVNASNPQTDYDNPGYQPLQGNEVDDAWVLGVKVQSSF
ncbi:carbohydrate porin [Pseudomonas sp. KU43P]|uniref:carbohydrate porin n=1 Tax=Pseudomonas sp. KU43P TaxID=2487887 RepID=UPI003988659C